MARNLRNNSRTVYLLGVLVLMMISFAKSALCYPTFQMVLFKKGLRSSGQSPAAFRYLASNAQGGKGDKFSLLKRQQQLLDVAEEQKLDEKSVKKYGDNEMTATSFTSDDTADAANRSDASISSTNSVEQANNNAKPWSRNFLGALRRGAGGLASVVGFISSATTSIVTDRAQFRRSRPIVEAFTRFLKSSGIDLELSQTLNVHLLRNVIVLGRAQKVLAERLDCREHSRSKRSIKIPSREEALRYMRYATSAYGSEMIAAAEMDARGNFDTRLSPLLKTRISEHIRVPEEDIIIADVDHAGDGNHLRHFVAVDHANRKVVLAIRGTFTLSEIIVDVAAFSRPCYGGEAHSEMMTMAERVWGASGATVRELLQTNDGYEFILTGHSLGAGTACLLNIMCHNDGNKLVDGRKVRCFAFAAPPVFSPLELVPGAVKSATNYIHDKDVVPFLSVDSVRHVFSSVRVIEEHMNKLSRLARFKLTAGISNPEDDDELIQVVQKASEERLEPKKGAPVLSIPAAANIWMREQESGEYNAVICDSVALSKLGLHNIDIGMFEDHLPPRYEHAFENLVEE